MAADRLGSFRLFVGIALAFNCYQNKRLKEKLDLLLEKENLTGRRIEEVHIRTRNLEALLAKPRAK